MIFIIGTWEYNFQYGREYYHRALVNCLAFKTDNYCVAMITQDRHEGWSWQAGIPEGPCYSGGGEDSKEKAMETCDKYLVRIVNLLPDFTFKFIDTKLKVMA